MTSRPGDQDAWPLASSASLSDAAVATAMRAVGGAAVLAGGIVAAVTGPLALTRGSWLAAYLVLVVGVAQYSMGAARRCGQGVTGVPLGWVQFGLWNLGGLAVMVGTLARTVMAVWIGSAALLVAVLLAFLVDRQPGDRVHPRGPLWTVAYRLLLVILAVSIPVGIVLSVVRNN